MDRTLLFSEEIIKNRTTFKSLPVGTENLLNMAWIFLGRHIERLFSQIKAKTLYKFSSCGSQEHGVLTAIPPINPMLLPLTQYP